jgi:WXG100 family type VII secretion target
LDPVFIQACANPLAVATPSHVSSGIDDGKAPRRTCKEAQGVSTYSIGTEELHGASTRVQGGAGQIDGILGQLRSTVDSTSSFWTGGAQTAMHGFYMQWDKAARDLHLALEGIAKTLQTNAVNYQGTEDSAKASWAH